MGTPTLKDLRAATTFLTRLPVGGGASSPEGLARGVPWFPVVGALVGILVAVVYSALLGPLRSFVASAVAVALGVLLTGAFHEDGLADTADAFGGARGREETLRVLKDPRLGTYGVLALVLDIAIRVGAVSALDGDQALVVLPAAHAISRAGAVALLAGPIARDAGLGASYGSAVTGGRIAAAIVAGLMIGGLALGPTAGAGALGVAVVALVVARMARRRIGGVTGDLLGCVQQVGEIVILLIAVAALREGWLTTPWWAPQFP